ncbi:MAG: HAMP domain-containing protein, partial [Sedimentisphaerales bacterium]|nr:HAMP domain-containing protein [Sedimentisphaerales bacterium]
MDRKKKQEKHSGFRQMIMFVLHNMTIKHKLISIIMATCIVALLLAGTVFILWEWSTLRHTMAQNLSTQAEMIADNCKAAVAFEDAMDAKKTLGALKAETSIVFGGVYGKDGKLFAGYYKDNIGAGVQPSELQKDRYSFGEGFLTVFKPIVLDADTIGTVCLRSDLQPMYAMLKRNIKVIISLLFLASMAAYFVSSRLQRVISGPILSLAESAITIGKGELDHRVNIQSGDEIGHLASSFNEMTENLRKSTTSIDNLNREIAERKQVEE